MWNFLNRGVSTPIAITVILVLAVLVGGFCLWQYSAIQKEKEAMPEVETPGREIEEGIELHAEPLEM